MDGNWVDIAFPLIGGPLPRAYRMALDRALSAACPWLSTVPGAAVHPLKLSAGSSDQPLLSGRTRLVLRLPADTAERARGLQGTRLDLGDTQLLLGQAAVKPVTPWGSLYAHLVVSPFDDESSFLEAVARELDGMAVQGRVICGRRQVVGPEQWVGYGLMVDGLSANASLTLQRLGLGPHRRLGCGVFVPHKSAAAVGVPD